MKHWPLVLLGLIVTRHYVWPLMPDAMQTSAWTIGSALVVTAYIAGMCVVATWLGAPVATTVAVSVWWIVEEVFVIGCEIAYLINGAVPTGDERCTAQLGLKFGTFGIFMVALLLVSVIYDSNKAEGGAQNVD